MILDRGIDWTHPDFIKPDGTTRIKAILDLAPGSCIGTEYSEAQINAALSGSGPVLPTRDAVGHGTVTAGAAAGNGRAAASGKYRGIAPEADLIIAKITGGAPAHGTQAAEPTYYCGFQSAFIWAVSKAQSLHQPFVLLPNIGSQYGPIDGTDSESRLVDSLIGDSSPGRIFAIGTGDDGGLPNHAGGSFSAASDTVLPFSIQSAGSEYIQIWYTGSVPATVTVAMADGTTVGPVGPGSSGAGGSGSISVFHPNLGQDQFQSSSGDRLVMINVNGRAGNGEVRIRAQNAGTGRFDAYGYVSSNLRFTGLLAPGRISGLAATRTAVVTSVYVDRTQWIDLDGVSRVRSDEGLTGQRWTGSSSGPTRDGRSPGCDVAFPGHLGFAAYGRNTYWATFRGNQIQDGIGWYGQYGAASGAAPLLTGSIALLLQLDPTLTAARLRQVLRQTARQDASTGAVPNNDWCYGKVDLYAAAAMIADAAGDPGVVEFASSTSSVSEGAGFIDLAVRRKGGHRGVISVQYQLSGGAASEGADVTGTGGAITWQDGDSSDKTIRLTIIDDSLVESTETAVLSLALPVGTRLGLQTQTTVSVSDNDVAPTQPVQPSSNSGGGAISLGMLCLMLGLNARRIWTRS